MKPKRVLYFASALILIACALSYNVSAQNVQTTDERITPPYPNDRVCVAAQQAGADVGAKINACDSSLGTAKGEIWLTGGGTISTQVVISPNHTLRVMSGTYSATTNGAVIRLKDNSSLVCDSWGPTLQESTGSLVVSSPFTIVTPYNGSSLDAPNGALSQNITIRGCHLRGARSDFNSAPSAITVSNCHNCYIRDNWLDATRSIGINVGGGNAFGHYAQGVQVVNNLLTQVASQNIAVTNADGGILISQNIMRNLGQVGGPGLVPIDVEPNVGDRLRAVHIVGNMVDATVVSSNFPVQHGIVIQNGNGATPFGNVVVQGNTVIGAQHSQTVTNNILFAGITVRSASDVLVLDNYVQRNVRGINVDFGAWGVLVEDNRLVSCGSGSTNALVVDSSTNVTVSRNTLYNFPGDALGLPDSIARSIVESNVGGGSADNNRFILNYGNVSKLGANSFVVGEFANTNTLDFDVPSGVAPFTVTANAGKVINFDADKLDGQHGSFYQDATNLNAGTVATVRLGTGTANSSTFLRGDGTWAVPGSGSSGWTDDGAVVRLTTDADKMGVGLTNPFHKLEVSGLGATIGFFAGNSSGAGTNALLSRILARSNYGAVDGTSAAEIRFLTGSDVWYKGQIAFFTNDYDSTQGGFTLERMRLNSAGNLGIGTTTPASKLQVTGGDVYVNSIGSGVIIRSPNGSCFRITVSDSGTLSTSGVTCP